MITMRTRTKRMGVVWLLHKPALAMCGLPKPKCQEYLHAKTWSLSSNTFSLRVS